MTADPKTLLTGPLRRAGIPNADNIVLEQLALLRGNHLLDESGGNSTTRRPAKPKAERKRCGGDCYAVELVGGVCPVCGWRPSA